MKLVWLRRDLRSIDNTALNDAIESGEPVVAIYIATPNQWHIHHMAPIQADFIYRRLFELQKELQLLNIPLLYREVGTYSDCAEVISQLVTQLHANEVLVNYDYEINELARDEAVIERLGLFASTSSHHVSFRSFHDKCALVPGTVLNKQGAFFKVFTPFKKAWLAQFTVATIRAPSPIVAFNLPPSLVSWLFSDTTSFSYPRKDSGAWPVDFDSIRLRLRSFCRNSVARYHLERDFPAINGTSQLSPDLAIGALSVRQCIARLHLEASDDWNTGHDVWLTELIWREFYQHLIWFAPRLCKGESFHDWGRHLNWSRNSEHLLCWKEGRTGYPIVDAAMRQLNQTGWMHNRLRMIVASFLTKDLHISWREGERYFMEKLIDGDYPANNGGWQWCASTGCDGQPYFRIFNPITQGEKFDPQGTFIRFWLPEIASLDSGQIHKPWLSILNKSLKYPSPVVDHKVERGITLERYQMAKEY
jgi:deoxyribodipyrimidine photo-lyase